MVSASMSHIVDALSQDSRFHLILLAHRMFNESTLDGSPIDPSHLRLRIGYQFLNDGSIWVNHPLIGHLNDWASIHNVSIKIDQEMNRSSLSPHTLDLWFAYVKQDPLSDPLPGIDIQHRIAMLCSAQGAGQIRIPSIGSIFDRFSLIALLMTILGMTLLLAQIKKKGRMKFLTVFSLMWRAILAPQILKTQTKTHGWKRFLMAFYITLSFWLVMIVPILELVKAFLYAELIKPNKGSIETIQDAIDRHERYGIEIEFEASQMRQFDATGYLKPGLRSLDAQIIKILQISKELQRRRGEKNDLHSNLIWPRLIQFGKLILISNSMHIEMYKSSWAAYGLEIAPNRYIQSPITMGYLGRKVPHRKHLHKTVRHWDEMGIVGRCRLGFIGRVRDAVSRRFGLEPPRSETDQMAEENLKQASLTSRNVASPALNLASGLAGAGLILLIECGILIKNAILRHITCSLRCKFARRAKAS